MAHPHQSHRQHMVEKSRVGAITRGYASGGAVEAPGSNLKIGKKAFRQRDAQAVEGGSAKERMDRPGRARGGRAPKSTVNVIIAPQGGKDAAPMPPPGLAAAGPPPMPPRPMMPPPGAGPVPPGGPPMPPPGIRSSGGRTYASGGAVKSGPAWEEGRRNGTQVQNNPSGKSDQHDVGRKRVITYKTGGAVFAPEKGGMGPKFKGGAGGGEARIEKEARAAKRYAKAK